MLLSDLFMYLAYGELSQMAIGSNNQGGIDESDYPKLISHINLGLTNLHSRLPLKQSQAIIALQSGQTLYPLVSNYAVNSDSEQKPKFILDSSVDPFNDDVLKIEEVYSEEGISLPLNDSNDSNSLYTPSHNTLQVPSAEFGKSLAVIYRANHPKLPAKRGVDVSAIEIDIPAVLVEPLLTFVVGRVVGAGNSETAMREAAAYQTKYEIQLQDIKNSGALALDRPSNTRLRNNGWV